MFVAYVRKCRKFVKEPPEIVCQAGVREVWVKHWNASNELAKPQQIRISAAATVLPLKREREREGNNMLWHVPQRFEDLSDLALFPNEIVLWISTFNYQNPIKNGRKNDSLLLQRPLAVILMACPKCVIKTDRHIFSLLCLLWFCNHFHSMKNGHR